MRSIRTSIVATLVLVGTSLAATINVPADYATIQAAVDAAVGGDEVVVAPGTYTGTGDQAVDMLGKVITLRASGTAEETIIDGEDSRRGITCDNDEGADTIIEGFTITGGSATYGGGIYCDESNPTLTECTISDNTASFGGGIYFYSSDPTITDCTISSNTADELGGGILYNHSSPTIIIITDCTISDNTAYYGGGIRCSGGSPTITGCTISDNIAGGSGGGISCSASGSPTLTDAVVCGNDPDQIIGDWADGGGTCVAYSCTDSDDDGILNECDGCP